MSESDLGGQLALDLNRDATLRSRRIVMVAKPLSEALSEWTCFDGTEWAIAKCLGLMPADLEWNSTGMKGAFWSANLLGNNLYRILERLIQLGAVEENDDGKFRWRPDFSWEAASHQDDPEDR